MSNGVKKNQLTVVVAMAELSSQQREAALLMASGHAGKDIAQKLQITQETVSRWKKDYYFQAALNGLIAEAADAARTRLRFLALKASETIEKAINDESVPLLDRCSLAFKLLEMLKVNPDVTAIGSDDPEKLQKDEEWQAYMQNQLNDSQQLSMSLTQHINCLKR